MNLNSKSTCMSIMKTIIMPLLEIRLSAHSLETEHGRWHKPIVPEKDRTC